MLPGLEVVLDRLVGSSFGAIGEESAELEEIARSVRWVVVQRLVNLAADEAAGAGVRSRVEGVLRTLTGTLGQGADEDPSAVAHRAFLAQEIDRHFSRSGPPTAWSEAAGPLPPGSPIGTSIGGCSLSTDWTQ